MSILSTDYNSLQEKLKGKRASERGVKTPLFVYKEVLLHIGVGVPHFV